MKLRARAVLCSLMLRRGRRCAVVGVATVITLGGVAHAEPRAEAAATSALARAEDDYLAVTFEKGLRRLQAAERTCGEARCTAHTRAALVRDSGVMQLYIGNRDAALASFRRAKTLDPTIGLNPNYATKELRELWDGGTSVEAQPAEPAVADFIHTPPSEAPSRTPLAVHVEAARAAVLASVILRYKSSSTNAFRRTPLARSGGGWGGYVPCADVLPGTMSYYVQGFDKDGELVASAGDPKRPFNVTVRDSLSAEPIGLPGDAPPKKCAEEQLEKLDLLEGERCTEDRQCRSGSCSGAAQRSPPDEASKLADAQARPSPAGHCNAIASPEPAAPGEHDWARLWIGVAGSLDFTPLPSAVDVCKTQSVYWCTTPDGADYPAGQSGNDALISGRAGAPPSQLQAGGLHATVTIDYALTPGVLVGVRLGYVIGAYPGAAASGAGKTLATPLHAELRGTWVFGDEPLTKPGLAPYAFVGAGVARWDAPTTVNVGEKGVIGDRAVLAWRVAGPAFASLGGGARYQFSPRVAASAGIDVTAALFPGVFAIVAAPEFQLQYGF